MMAPRSSVLWLLTLFAAGLPFPGSVFASESNIHEDAASILLETDDGLRIRLHRQTGAALGLEAGGKAVDLGGKALIRFEEVVELPGAADLLGAMDAGIWNMPEEAAERPKNATSSIWLRVDGVAEARPKRSVAVHQGEPQPLVLSGRCKVDPRGEALGWINRNLALNALCRHSDGTAMPEQSAYFGQYQHGPQESRRVLCPDKPIETVDLALTAPSPESTAWYAGVRLTPAQYRHVPIVSPLERIDHQVLQEFRDDASGLEGVVSLLPRGDCIEVRCRFRSTTEDDRALSVYVALSVDAVGGLWYDHVRKARPIETGQLYRDGFWYGAGRDGYNSAYPMACIVTKDNMGLAVATALDEPRVFQTEYDAHERELRIRFDLGLSPAAGQWANRGEVSAYLFTFEARDGFRGAADKYHRMFPWAFERRVETQGLWLPFISPRRVAGDCEEFQFQFLESATDMGWAERQGMYSLRYAEPWILHQEMPPTVPAEEVHGPTTPASALELAHRLTSWDGPTLPLDMRRRYAAYRDHRVLDTWGQPLGYFFRSPGGRNENMMMVNPTPGLPVRAGSPFGIGDWDREIIREVMAISKQWHLPGWTLGRTDAHPFFDIDTEHKVSGRQSARFEPVQSKTFWEQYLRGVAQVFYYDGQSEGPFTLAFHACGEHIPAKGARFFWDVTRWFADGTSDNQHFDIEGLGREWRQFEFTCPAKDKPAAILVQLRTSPWEADPTVLWIDDVSLVAPDSTTNLLTNGGFEEADLLPCEPDGVYLDTIECYEAYFNYDPAHWAFARAPLTFDWGRRPTMHQVFSHIAFAREMAQELRLRDKLLFGNCAPRTCFAAPWLDVMGDEVFWKLGGKWVPSDDARLSFVRFMCATKPFCLLQYGDLTLDEQERYLKRCLFYGALPSNQLGWYWANPMAVARHREAFKRYVPTIVRLAEAGWEPLTFASSDNPSVWLERFGQGGEFYLTCFNPGPGAEQAIVSLDPRLGLGQDTSATVLLRGGGCEWENAQGVPRIRVVLDPEDVAVIAISQ